MARRFTIKERINSVRNYYSSGNNASKAARKAGENPSHASTVMRLFNFKCDMIYCNDEKFCVTFLTPCIRNLTFFFNINCNSFF